MPYHINGIIVLDVFLIVYSQKAEYNLANCYLAESDLADNKLAAVRFWTECYMAESFFCAWISVFFFVWPVHKLVWPKHNIAAAVCLFIADLCFDFSWLPEAHRVVSSGIPASPSVIIRLKFQPFSRWTLVCCSMKALDFLALVYGLLSMKWSYVMYLYDHFLPSSPLYKNWFAFA